MLDIELGILIDEGGLKIPLFDVLPLKNEDVLDHSADESWDIDGIGIRFDPSGGLKEERSAVGDGRGDDPGSDASFFPLNSRATMVAVATSVAGTSREPNIRRRSQ